MKILYSNLNQKLQENKSKVISKANKSREELPDTIPTKVYVRNKQAQGKTKNKYKSEEIKSKTIRLQTAEIAARHKNTSENIHLSNIKRPKKTPYKFISGSSPSETQQSK